MKAGQKQTGKTDTVLWVLVLILVVLGLGALFSASEYNGRVRFHDSAYYFKKQLFATALGLLVMYLASRVAASYLICTEINSCLRSYISLSRFSRSASSSSPSFFALK